MIKLINSKRNKKGFTLVELVVVIAILGILASIAVPKLTGSMDRSKWSAHAANIRTIEGAIAMFEADGGDMSKITISEAGVETTTTFLTTYLKSWPAKPGKYKITAGVFEATPTIADTLTKVNSANKFE